VNIRVQYHGIFAQIAKCREEQIDLPDGASTLDALKTVGRLHPALAEALFLTNGAPAPYARPFVNGGLADDLSRPLRDADEIALLPALSGGASGRVRANEADAVTRGAGIPLRQEGPCLLGR
jgi:molybdopterin converting factor small subunit